MHKRDVALCSEFDDSAVRRTLLPYVDLADHFESLEGIATKCSIDEVSFLLQKAKLAWMRAYSRRPPRQSDIRSSFSKPVGDMAVGRRDLSRHVRSIMHCASVCRLD